MPESIQINLEEEEQVVCSRHKIQGRAEHIFYKVASAERILLVTNLILELSIAVLDQLSSKHKPLYVLLGVVLSFTVLLISIVDLVFKGKRERVSLVKKGLIPWFYYPCPKSKPFGTFVDVVGLLCGIFQCIFVSVGYMFVSRNADNPIKVSVWPIVFAFGLLYCRLYGHHTENRPTSHTRRLKRAEKFTLVQLAAATNHFSQQNRIRRQSFGDVYRGELPEGRQVAVVVKRGEKGLYKWIDEEEVQDGFEEMVERRKTGLYKLKRSQFEAEVEFISRLHHEHLVRLVGFCEDRDEKLLVYEYVKNGSLYDLLHNKNNFRRDRSIIYKWKMRIKIALDAARGIEYLHNYAVPMIHGDINSSNIMLDANWTGKVCAFGLSLMSPESERGYRPMNIARTVGYTDPEYFRLNVLTSKSDVYSFGVVLLELLTGKRVVFMDGYVRATSLVEFAMPTILSGELAKVLDPRASLPRLNEGEAVELVAYTALHCLNPEGANRPCMTDVVANLERSLSLCDSSNSVEDEPLLRREHGNV